MLVGFIGNDVARRRNIPACAGRRVAGAQHGREPKQYQNSKYRGKLDLHINDLWVRMNGPPFWGGQCGRTVRSKSGRAKSWLTQVIGTRHPRPARHGINVSSTRATGDGRPVRTVQCMQTLGGSQRARLRRT